ncbi:4809_t:CDS:2 [Acaulospora morrowiae]|uniref:Enolase-phosphatase E1 n=1 Tax=Acaulospora morrowiae TaxID=94023 RepID=A0A9N9HCG5_9GLOM|nr:4809_t:CDS:2 [Acaulospora morrowiae]
MSQIAIDYTYKCVLLDIEGTTTPISFVHDKLFPFVTNNLENFLNKNWKNNELQEQIQLLREQAIKDVSAGEFPDAKAIPEEIDNNEEEVKNAVIQNITWQMKLNRKIAALKSFQGYMWRGGYESGELKGIVYQDVIEALKRWREIGIKIYIYSSGSIAAQKLLFGYSDNGNLLEYFSGHFDTTIGSKLEKQSYEDIAKEVKFEPTEILFLSDNVKEIVAAKSAKFKVAIVDRPKNAPLSDKDRNDFIVFTDFLQVLAHPEFIASQG